MASETMVELAAGNLRLELSPSIGGAISAFEWTDGDVARRYCAIATVRSKMCWRRAASRWCPSSTASAAAVSRFRGREVRLAPNMAGDPSPLHGQGWLSPWTVEQAGERGAVLSFAHRAGEWPWAYDARQEFALDERGLSVRLTCRNASGEPMPCGLGQHPYFPCGPETRIETEVTHVWTIDEHVLPVDKVPADGPLRSARSAGMRAGPGPRLRRLERRGADERPGLALRAPALLARRAILPALFAASRRDFRRRAGDPRQCRAECAGGASGRSLGCACSSRARR